MATPLDIGPPPTAKVVAGAGCAAIIGLGGLLLVGSRRAAARLDDVREPGPLLGGAADQTDLVSAGLADLLRLAGLGGLPLILLGVYLAVRLLRRAAWLDGTRLSVRGALVTGTADLAHADVTLRRGVLVAQDPGRGRRVRLPVRALPPYALRRVAGATGDELAAARLRALAADSV